MRTTRLFAINASVGVPPEVSITTAAENVTVAWASTVYAFQGRTVDTVIAAMEANHPNLTNQKTLYVEISRARDRAELVTDDTKALRERLEAATGERITALEAFGDNPRDAPENEIDGATRGAAESRDREGPLCTHDGNVGN